MTETVKEEGGMKGWLACILVILCCASVLLGPMLAIDTWDRVTWKDRLAKIRAPYEFENRETMFKLCTTFLEWEVKYGDAQPIKGMDVICVPEIPPKMPIRLQAFKKQDRLPEVKP